MGLTARPHEFRISFGMDGAPLRGRHTLGIERIAEAAARLAEEHYRSNRDIIAKIGSNKAR
jgi:hypothetical protein